MSPKSSLYLSFNPFYPLKCIQGAEENELHSAQRLHFSEHGHYRRSAETEREIQMDQKVCLGCFLQHYCFTYVFLCFFYLLLNSVLVFSCFDLLCIHVFFPLVWFSLCTSFQITLLLSVFTSNFTGLLLFLFI